MTVEEIKEKLKELKSANDSISLTGVYPRIVEEAVGGIHWDTYETNGWDGDYWFSNSTYSVSGTMFEGTAKIALMDGEESE